MNRYVSAVVDRIAAQNRNQPEFLRAVEHLLSTLEPLLASHPDYRDASLLERMARPEHVTIFRVPWVDDAGAKRVNLGFCVQMNSAVGPYKGALRFRHGLDLGVVKSLAFEQVVKNALTTLPLGGADGGSDFDPKGRSEGEVERFCRSFVTERQRHVGPFAGVPLGGAGVGAREIGYLVGPQPRPQLLDQPLDQPLEGFADPSRALLAGRQWGSGEPVVHLEATGHGVVYFAEQMLATRQESLAGKRCLVSGSGKVARHVAAKLIEFGARPVTLSDSDGFVVDEEGIDEEKLAFVSELKNLRRARIAEYAERYRSARYVPAAPRAPSVWAVPADCAFPCATEGEIAKSDAEQLLANGVTLVAEGADMAADRQAIDRFLAAGLLYGPSKAASAGGVAVAGLETARDAGRPGALSGVGTDERLRTMMASIHDRASETADAYGEPGNYLVGANIAGFARVADAMLRERGRPAGAGGRSAARGPRRARRHEEPGRERRRRPQRAGANRMSSERR